MKFKYHFLYETINLVNNKIYIGVHSTNNLNDNYLGSGKILKKAIKKYGEKQFRRKILKLFLTEKEAYKEEEKIVNEKFILRTDVYNITLGGQGGYNNISINGKNNISKARKNKVVALNTTTNKKIVVTKEEFDKNENLVGHTKGFVVVTENGKDFFQVDKNDKRYKNGELYPPSKNLIMALNIKTNEKIVVTKEEFDKNENLVGHTKGSKQSIESNLKRSNTLKGRKPSKSVIDKIKCPYCEKIGNIANMKRWHFDNCKNKK